MLVAGDYDGVLEPDVHYLPVRADFADADAVVERLGDHALLERLAERAHRDLVLSGRYGYAALAARIEAVLDEERPLAARPAAAISPRPARGERLQRAVVARRAGRTRRSIASPPGSRAPRRDASLVRRGRLRRRP